MNKRPELWQEETISSKPIYEGQVITLQVDTVRLPDGGTATREIVRHPGAAAVVALLGDKLIVVEQYRKPMEKFQVEIPAGKLDGNEDPRTAAFREFEEETGFKAADMKLISAFYTSPGFADEKLYLYWAEGLTKGQMSLDEEEFLAVSTISFEEAQQYIREERISDAKTMMAVYAWQRYRMTGEI
ncbi:NUDIX domain-containing protein [Paenibacillus sp. 1P07SE]|uniref:NUDIX domain-containing protein n=1 Tax=Paenibacillus sp. 1P07SE TaxID=3132209 RepID=UPI0039A59C9D